jgi:hypothetical protein
MRRLNYLTFRLGTLLTGDMSKLVQEERKWDEEHRNQAEQCASPIDSKVDKEAVTEQWGASSKGGTHKVVCCSTKEFEYRYRRTKSKRLAPFARWTHQQERKLHKRRRCRSNNSRCLGTPAWFLYTESSISRTSYHHFSRRKHSPTPKKALNTSGAAQCVRPAVHPTQIKQMG